MSPDELLELRLAERGLTIDDGLAGGGRWSDDRSVYGFPYRHTDESVVWRILDPARSKADVNLRWRKGASVKGAVLRLGDPHKASFVIVAEGESDGLAAWRHLRRFGDEFAVLCIPGAGMVGDDLSNFVGNGARVVVATDADDAGDKSADRVWSVLFEASVDESLISRLRPEVPGVDKPDLRDVVEHLERNEAETDVGHTLRRLLLDAGQAPHRGWPMMLPARASHPQQPEGVAGSRSTADVVLAADVAPQRVEWLWGYRVALGKLNVLTGDPDVGKSTITLDIAARVTRGDRMPDGSPGLERPRNVLVMGAAEDGLADTIIPRLSAAGADLNRVIVLRGIRDEATGERRLFEAPRDLPHLADLIDEEDIGLVVVDSLMAVLPGSVDSHRDQDIRLALHPLAELAEDTAAAVLFIRHTTKQIGRKAIDRGGGSRAVGAVVRAELMATRDPADPQRRLLSLPKSNLAPEEEKSRSITYRTFGVSIDHPDGGPPIETSRIEWGEAVNITADDALAALEAAADEDTVDAESLILDALLRSGPMKGTDLESSLRGAGVAKHVFERTRSRMRKGGRIVRYQESRAGGGAAAWWWKLPDHTSPQDRGEVCPPEPTNVSISRDFVSGSGTLPLHTENQGSVLPRDGREGHGGARGGGSAWAGDEALEGWRDDLPEGVDS